MPDELLLGWQGKPGHGRWLKAEWDDMISVLVFGLTGAGKTSTMAHLAAQAAIQGKRLIVADPHGGQRESLAARLSPLRASYWKPPYVGMDECLKAFAEFDLELHRRMERANHYFRETGEPWDYAMDHLPAIVLIADEFNQLVRKGKKKVTDPLKNLGQAGRKFGLYAIVSGQWATVQAFGGDSELRGAFPSQILLRMAPDMMSHLMDLPKVFFPMAGRLARGEAYIRLAAGPLGQAPERARVPLMTQEGLELVANDLAAEALPLPVVPPGPPARRSSAGVSDARRQRIWAERERALALFADGETVGDTAVLVQGGVVQEQGRKKDGRLRNDGSRVVEEILREIVREYLAEHRSGTAA